MFTQQNPTDRMPEHFNNNHGQYHEYDNEVPLDNNQEQVNSGPLAYLRSRGFVDHFSYKVHGTQAAFEVKPDITRKGWHTLRIESALSTGKNGRITNYDWNNKTTIQLTKGELPVFIAVMLTLLPSCEYSNHGEDSTKGFMLEFQQDKIFANIRQKDKKVSAIPIPLVDALMIGNVALSQYAANFPQLTTDSALVGIKLLSQRMMNLKKTKSK
jgi:hypothetical protein